MKNTKLRVSWIIPNVFCYLMFIGSTIFIIQNSQGLQETNRLNIWVFAVILLFIISMFGSVRIWSWIKAGKM